MYQLQHATARSRARALVLRARGSLRARLERPWLKQMAPLRDPRSATVMHAPHNILALAAFTVAVLWIPTEADGKWAKPL